MRQFLIIIYILCITATGWAQQTSQGQYGKTNIADLVLIYQGGTHRPMEWTKEQFLPYIIHEDSKGKKNWLYDGFLFLEFKDGKGRVYAPGYDKLNARKTEWEWLLDRNFEKNKAFYALNEAIQEQKPKMKKLVFKHKLVVGIPSPIFNQKDWGQVDGKDMDFSKHEDRITAGKWYIDRFLERYKAAAYANLKLEGFYWVDEDVNGCAEILEPLGDYIRSKGLRFYWIPYWNAKGFDQWRKFKFDFAWLQPNHFFNKKIPDSRIDQACDLAKKLGMGVEMEFDSHALNGSKEQKSGRLKAYIEAFKRNGAFAESPIAYYEGGNGMYLFSKSKDPKDKALMDELAVEIIKRKNKSFMKKISKEGK
jgi:hypothetical protein